MATRLYPMHSLRPPSPAAQNIVALVITEKEAGGETTVVRLGARI